MGSDLFNPYPFRATVLCLVLLRACRLSWKHIDELDEEVKARLLKGAGDRAGAASQDIYIVVVTGIRVGWAGENCLHCSKSWSGRVV